MRRAILVVWAGLVVLALTGMVRAGAITSVQPCFATTQPAKVYQRLEWRVDLDRAYDNPFDPAAIAVDATFVGPVDPGTGRARRLVLPAFWHQEYQGEGGRSGAASDKAVPVGAPHWRVRFAAPAPGDWKMTVTAVAQGGCARWTGPAQRFTVAPGAHRGLVRRAPGNPRYLQFDSGAPFFAVGLNLAWPGQGGLRDMERWFGKLQAAEGNFARVWMPLFGAAIEHRRSGLGRYDLAHAHFHDQVLELADRHGLVVMLALGNYMDLSAGEHWPVNPYGSPQGGPVLTPADFATSPEARAFYQRRLRYLIGRYAAYTSLGFWELWNEQNPHLVSPAWTREMAAYLKTHDPYQRLVTTSFAGTPDAQVWKLDEIDLTQYHAYGSKRGLTRDLSPLLTAVTRQHDAFAKPHLAAEFGIHAGGSCAEFDPEGLGTHLHTGLWAAAMAGGTGGGCPWWWDNYIEPKNLWPRFTGLARFAKAVDWPRRQFQPLAVESPTLPVQGTETFSDALVPTGGGWGKYDGQPVRLGPDGQATGVLPEYLYGPAQKDLRQRATLLVDLPRDGRLLVRVVGVSDFANLRVYLDDRPVVDLPFSPLPGAGEFEMTQRLGTRGHFYQAVFDVDRGLDVPAGPHRIGLDLHAGDWMTLGGVVVTGAVPSRYSGLRVLALTDADAGETLAWLADPACTWQADRQKLTPRQFARCLLTLPASQPGAYQVDWWDTRAGQVIQTETAVADKGKLALTVPTFQRDIAVRVTRQR